MINTITTSSATTTSTSTSTNISNISSNSIADSYYDNDFDYNDWITYITTNTNFKLPEILSCHSTLNPHDTNTDNSNNIDESIQWNSFYHYQSSGKFYKPRRYLIKEFKKYLSFVLIENENTEMISLNCNNNQMILLEIGSGYGCSIYPMLSSISSSMRFIATDFSLKALTIFQENLLFDSNRIELVQWDATQSFPLKNCQVDITLVIFVLSSILPKDHKSVFDHINQILKPNSVLLFRDYGLYDMTMYRHDIRLDQNLYRRKDGTLVYYFTKEYLIELAISCNFIVEEITYATVLNKNRSKKLSMHRIFIHAVFRKPNE